MQLAKQPVSKCHRHLKSCEILTNKYWTRNFSFRPLSFSSYWPIGPPTILANPWTVAAFQSYITHPQPYITANLSHTSLHLCHTPLNLSHTSLNLSHTSLNLSHTLLHLSHTSSNLSHTSLNLSHTSLNLSHTLLHLSHTSPNLSHTSLNLSHTSLNLSHTLLHLSHTSPNLSHTSFYFGHTLLNLSHTPSNLCLASLILSHTNVVPCCLENTVSQVKFNLMNPKNSSMDIGINGCIIAKKIQSGFNFAYHILCSHNIGSSSVIMLTIRFCCKSSNILSLCHDIGATVWLTLTAESYLSCVFLLRNLQTKWSNF